MGIMAWLTFLGVVLQSFLTSIVQNLFSGENQVFKVVLPQYYCKFCFIRVKLCAILRSLEGVTW